MNERVTPEPCHIMSIDGCSWNIMEAYIRPTLVLPYKPESRRTNLEPFNVKVNWWKNFSFKGFTDLIFRQATMIEKNLALQEVKTKLPR